MYQVMAVKLLQVQIKKLVGEENVYGTNINHYTITFSDFLDSRLVRI